MMMPKIMYGLLIPTPREDDDGEVEDDEPSRPANPHVTRSQSLRNTKPGNVTQSQKRVGMTTQPAENRPSCDAKKNPASAQLEKTAGWYATQSQKK